VIIDARYLIEDEKNSPGMIIDMPVHKVLVGERIFTDSIEHGIKMRFPPPKPVEPTVPFSINFDRGLKFQDSACLKFGHPVNFKPNFKGGEFLLVISFGRGNFKLDIQTVGIVLQRCFGGSASLIQVVQLRDRVFRFEWHQN
jgi:hypothetical protein